MRIKRIEIIGFKSFCDRTVIHIDTPITSIVGPNGCGKSNIVDAIRWCMGEQSAKHLRGKAMDDVIFAGSESRGPASMAEVSLTFEDVGFSHEALALALHDHSEQSEGGDDLDEAGESGDGASSGGGSAESSDGGSVEVAGESTEPADGGGSAEVAGESTEPADGGESAAAEPAATADTGATAPTAEAGEGGGSVESAAAAADGEPDVPPEHIEASREVEQFLQERPPAFDFARYTEVTVSRRLFRDGSSTYLINKTPCRLRDVTDFFLGTGVGTKAYSIIEQGRIGMIVSARPQDRRTLIEEAAGITKFKTKKRAAERKLEQTRHNLVRVSDITTELENRMGALRRQAQKAERYRRYKGELRDIELWKASHKLLEMQVEDRMLSFELAGTTERLDQMRGALEARDAEVVAERAELAVEERRLSGLQDRLYELENRISLGDSKVEYQTREAGEIEQRVASARVEISGLEERRAEGARALADSRDEISAIAERAEQAEAETLARETAATEAREQLDRAQSELEEARGELSAARADLVRSESISESLVRRRDETTRRLERLGDDADDLDARCKGLARELTRSEGALAELRQTRLDLGSQLEAFEAARADLEARTRGGEAEVETLRTELHRRRSRLGSLVEIHEKYEGFARGTRAVMQAADDTAPDGGGQRARADLDVVGLVADVIAAPESLEVAVEAALGDRLGGVLVRSHDAGARAVQFLKRSSAGRSAFVPMAPIAPIAPIATIAAASVRVPDSVMAPARVSDGEGAEAAAFADADRAPPAVREPDAADVRDSDTVAAVAEREQTPASPTADAIVFEDRSRPDPLAGRDGVLGRMADLVALADGYDQIGARLFGDCVVVDGLDRAIALHAGGVAETLVTLEGDIVDGRGVVFGGSRDAQGAGVLAQKREIRELEQICDGLERDLAEAQAGFVAAKAELERVVRALEAARRESHAGDVAIMGHEKDTGRVRDELARARTRLGQLTSEKLELSERLAEIEAERAETAALHASASERMVRWERAQLGLIDGVTDGRARVDELSRLHTEARVALAQYAEKRSALQANARALEATDRELLQRLDRLTAEIADGEARCEALRREARELAEALAVQRGERRELAEALEAGRSAYEHRVADLQVAEAAMRDLRGQEAALARAQGELRVRLGNLHANRQLLEEGIEDRYQVRLSRIIGDYHLRPQVGESEEKRLGQLKRLIERMSADINLTAIEEYAEVSERHAFLDGQRRDLDRAVTQLEKAITKINGTSRRLFRDTYTAVKRKFEEVFPRLFRGGRATLQLTAAPGAPGTSDRDILEAGVEIIAQPPGKKNTTVDQLSGGEKALTAVALIFSIFLHKPSPFCLLDEVDAPLDDANVDRYNEIVREMTDRSQFIVITHNKRTMEIADNLYGVTMQEPGVSKLVSVNLSKLEQQAAA